MSYSTAAKQRSAGYVWSPRSFADVRAVRALNGLGATAIERPVRAVARPMSYTAGPRSFVDTRAVRAFNGLGAVTVGSLAKHDVVMSKASLAASEILKKATMASTAAAQLRVIRAEANRIQSGLALRFDDQLAVARAKGQRGMQSVFDALRVVIANALADDAIERIKAAVAHEGAGAEGLGEGTDYTGSDVACGIMSGTSALTSIIGAITHTDTAGASGSFTNAAGNFCGARTAANSAAQIDAQNQQTQANLQIAQLNAAQQAQNIAAAAEAQQAQMATVTKVALIGGGALLVGLIGFAVVKKI